MEPDTSLYVKHGPVLSKLNNFHGFLNVYIKHLINIYSATVEAETLNRVCNFCQNE